jgi:glycosyltransferase involved in cell wall biosynthesis
MRIAVISHNAAPVGGVESYVETIGPALIERGHQLGIWYETGTTVVKPDPLVDTWTAAGRTDAALRELAKWRPDVLFVQGVRSTSLEAQLLAMAPAVLFAHGYAGMCISGSKMHAAPHPTPCTREFGWKCLALYYPRRCGGWSPLTALGEYGVQSHRHRVLGSYRRIVVASAHMVAEFARHGHVNRVSLLPLPIDDSAGPSVTRTRDRWHLLYLGRLEKTKGPDIALDAAAAASSRLTAPVLLTIAGVGSLSKDVHARAARLQREIRNFDIALPGWVHGAERHALFADTDLLIVPSRWPEPFGLVGPEAGVHSIPAVGFDVGGISEWLRDGVNGRLVPYTRSPHLALAQGVVDCLGGDRTRFDEMRRAARACARRFGVQAHVSALEGILAQAVDRPQVV